MWRWDQQEPFGDNVADTNPSGFGTFDLPLRLPGQYFDEETNLHYNHHRDYNPALGRYGESDRLGLAGGLNTFAYVSGDPIQFRDPTGLILECKDVFDGFVTRPERIALQEEKWGWVQHCGFSARTRGTVGIPDPTDSKEERAHGFPGDVEFVHTCDWTWQMTQPAISITVMATLMRHHVHCEDRDKCPLEQYNLAPQYTSLDLAIP